MISENTRNPVSVMLKYDDGVFIEDRVEQLEGMKHYIMPITIEEDVLYEKLVD